MTKEVISIRQLIYRIKENPLLEAVSTSDIVTHVKTVIELIGVPGIKMDKKINLVIQDYRAELPVDFIDRTSVRYIRTTDKVVLTHATDEFIEKEAEVNEEEIPDTIYTHKIVNRFIYTDFKEGEIELLYRAYYTDENGWPMIPSEESLLKAIEYYIRSRYYEILADNNAAFERAYQRAETQYNWYMAQATSKLLTLDPVEAQALASSLIRLIPLDNTFYTNDKYRGQPENFNRNIW